MRTAFAMVCCFAVFGPFTARAEPARPEDYFPFSGGFRTLRTIEIAADAPQALAFSPDSGTLAVGDGLSVRFWDPRTGKERGEAWKFSGTVKSLAFVDSTTLAVIAAPRTSVSIRQYPEGKELARLDVGEKQSIAHLAVAKGMVAIATEGDTPSVRLFTGPKWGEARTVELAKKQEPLALVLCPTKKEVLVSVRGLGLGVFAIDDNRKAHFVFGSGALGFSDAKFFHVSTNEQQIAFDDPIPLVKNNRDPLASSVRVLDFQTKGERIFSWMRDRDGDGTPLGCQFTPDGKTLAIPCRGQTVRLYEMETGELRARGTLPCTANCFAISPDGRLFACSGTNSFVAVVEWRGSKLLDAEPISDAGRTRIWDYLGSQDSQQGFVAVTALCAKPTQAVKLLGENLRPVSATPNTVKQLITDLASEDYATREAAEKELAKLGCAVEVQLREAAKSDDPERRDRAIRLLKPLRLRAKADRLRALRAVEVLEHIGTPAACDVLKSLAGGEPSAGLTQDAKAALARLQAVAPKP